MYFFSKCKNIEKYFLSNPWSIFLYLIIIASFVSCKSTTPPKITNQLEVSDARLKKQGIIIFSPKNGEVIKKSKNITIGIITLDKLKENKTHVHVYLDDEMYSHQLIDEKIVLENIQDGLHIVDLLVANKGDDHTESNYKDSIRFIVDSGEHESEALPATQASSSELKPGLGFSSHEEAFNALLELIVSGDKANYEKVFGVTYEEVDKIYNLKKFEEMRSRLSKITDVEIIRSGVENVKGERNKFIFSKQSWNFKDGSKEVRELYFNFKEIKGRWVFAPAKKGGLL